MNFHYRIVYECFFFPGVISHEQPFPYYPWYGYPQISPPFVPSYLQLHPHSTHNFNYFKHVLKPTPSPHFHHYHHHTTDCDHSSFPPYYPSYGEGHGEEDYDEYDMVTTKVPDTNEKTGTERTETSVASMVTEPTRVE